MGKTPKVILIRPSYATPGYSFITPRGLYVMANATPVDLVGDPIVIDEAVEKFNSDIVQPGDIVGISSTTDECLPAYRALKKAKERGAMVIMGGIHATLLPDEPIKMGADAVVKGNGDVIWRKVIEDVLEGKLQRLYNGGRVPGEFLLPARWDSLDPLKYMFASVQTVVGCPENCAFCTVWITEGRHPRQRLTSKIIEEVRTLYRMGFRFIVFADDNFNPATLGRIAREESISTRKELERIREERLQFFAEYDKSAPEDMYAFTQMTSEVITDPEYLEAMYENMRIRVALVGVESFEEAGLKAARKTWNPVGKKMEEAIKTIQAQGIFVLSSIIGGLETDTLETFVTMREFAENSGTLLAQFVPYSPEPGSVDFWEMLQDMKLRSGAKPNQFNLLPKHKVRLLYDKYWIDPHKPKILIKHPNMDSKTLLKEIRKSWNSFYSWKEIIKRTWRFDWPLKSKIAFILGSRAFNALYGGHGLSSDSVKKKEISLMPRILMKLAIGFFNKHFRKKNQIASGN